MQCVGVGSERPCKLRAIRCVAPCCWVAVATRVIERLAMAVAGAVKVSKASAY